MTISMNPNFNWARFGGEALQDLGYGLADSSSIGNAFGTAARYGQAQQPLRAEADRLRLEDEAKQKAIADQAALRDKYSRKFMDWGKPDIAQGIADGLIDPGKAYWDHITPKQAEAVRGIEIDGKLVNPITGELMGDFSTSDTPKPTASMQEYEFARGQGYTGTFQQYETDMKRAGATSIDFNANQGSAAAYADRMASADAILSDEKLLPAMTDVTKPWLAGVPAAGNFLVGPEFQMAEQAQRDFVNAILRRESGAVISPSEFENAKKQYFPQPGDEPAVIQQKANNRKLAIQGVSRAAGPNYQAPPGIGQGAPQNDPLGIR